MRTNVVLTIFAAATAVSAAAIPAAPTQEYSISTIDTLEASKRDVTATGADAAVDTPEDDDDDDDVDYADLIKYMQEYAADAPNEDEGADEAKSMGPKVAAGEETHQLERRSFMSFLDKLANFFKHGPSKLIL